MKLCILVRGEGFGYSSLNLSHCKQVVWEEFTDGSTQKVLTYFSSPSAGCSSEALRGAILGP